MLVFICWTVSIKSGYICTPSPCYLSIHQISASWRTHLTKSISIQSIDASIVTGELVSSHSVGVVRFELTVLRAQTARSSQVKPHPVFENDFDFLSTEPTRLFQYFVHLGYDYPFLGKEYSPYRNLSYHCILESNSNSSVYCKVS